MTNLKTERVTLLRTLVTMYQPTLQNVPTQKTTVRISNAMETSYLTGLRKQQTDKRYSTEVWTLQDQTHKHTHTHTHTHIGYYSQVSYRGGLGSIPGPFFMLDERTAVYPC